MSQSNPINIPGRKLASSVPPQGNNPPMFTPPQSCASSFDTYCGHLDTASHFRDQWKKHVSSFKDAHFMKAYSMKESTNLKQTEKKNNKNVP